MRAASVGLTVVMGSRTSALSIDPARHSQYLIGAGLGSVNRSRARSISPRQPRGRKRAGVRTMGVNEVDHDDLVLDRVVKEPQRLPFVAD